MGGRRVIALLDTQTMVDGMTTSGRGVKRARSQSAQGQPSAAEPPASRAAWLPGGHAGWGKELHADRATCRRVATTSPGPPCPRFEPGWPPGAPRIQPPPRPPRPVLVSVAAPGRPPTLWTTGKLGQACLADAFPDASDRGAVVGAVGQKNVDVVGHDRGPEDAPASGTG